MLVLIREICLIVLFTSKASASGWSVLSQGGYSLMRSVLSFVGPTAHPVGMSIRLLNSE
jgi:hypothetical protein